MREITFGVGIGFFVSGLSILARDIVLQILAGDFIGNQTVSPIAQFGIVLSVLGIAIFGTSAMPKIGATSAKPGGP